MQICAWCGRPIEDWDCPRWRRIRGQWYCTFDCLAAGAYDSHVAILIGTVLVVGSMEICLSTQFLSNLTPTNAIMWIITTIMTILLVSYFSRLIATGHRIRKHKMDL